jgi:hypothetical protein
MLADSLRRHAEPGNISRNEKIFGLRSSLPKAIWKLHLIARNHEEVFAGLAHWLGRGGKILIVKGNHDLELHWPEVREAVTQEVMNRAAGADDAGSIARDNLLFSDDGATLDNIWIEHGHRWESIHAISGSPTADDSSENLRLPRSAAAVRYLVSVVERLASRVGKKPQPGWFARRFIRRSPVLAAVSIRVVPPVVAISVFTNGSALWYVSFGLLVFGRLTISRLCARLLTLGENVMAMKSVRQLGLGAKEVLSQMQGGAGTYPVYAVMGHTHVREVRQVLTPAGAAVYVNTGTWNPRRTPRSRRKAGGNLQYGFVRFTRERDAYTLAPLVWDDDARTARPTPA